jgi:hypothetical protein
MRVNADLRSRHDVRYKRLARRLGISHAEAFGRAVWVWFELYDRAGGFMSAEDIDIAAELDGFAAAMVTSELAEETPDGIRVRGNERAGWVERKRETAGEGGRARAATATRKSGRFVGSTTKHQHSTSDITSTPPGTHQPSHQPSTSPPALALALDQIPPQAALVPTPSKPETQTPGHQLRVQFVAWFKARYGTEYRWNATESTHAKRLMDAAGTGGTDEVMRRVEIAAKKDWRDSSLTLGAMVAGWNSFATESGKAGKSERPRDTRPPPELWQMDDWTPEPKQ